MELESFYRMRKLAFSELVALFVIGGFAISFQYQKEQLQNQLEQAQQQLADAKQLAGNPINIVDLPEGSYRRTDDERFAFVQVECDFPVGAVGPMIAAYCDKGKFPYLFNPKKIGKDASDF